MCSSNVLLTTNQASYCNGKSKGLDTLKMYYTEIVFCLRE